jgi:tetratricopeptide (TPR) repeat protein
MAKRREKPETPAAPPQAPDKSKGTAHKPPVVPRTAAQVQATGSVLDTFTEALAALSGKDWARAATLFQAVIAEDDLPEITGRARQFLAVAQQKAQPPAKETGDQDPYLQAVVAKNRGDLERALEIAKQGDKGGKDERFAYLVASIHALENRTEEAAEALSRAVELNSKNRIHAFHDADFAGLRTNRDYRHLFGLS